MSKIKVNEIEKASGSGITIPTGTSFTITDGLASSSLPTVPVSKGGTGLTSLGTANQVVAVNSGASALEFQDASSGKIGQILQTVKQDTASTTSQSFSAISGLSQAITPTATSSKVLVQITVQSSSASGTNAGGSFKLYRDGSEVTAAHGATAGNRITCFAQAASGTSQEWKMHTSSFQFLDSPNTTSSTTYQIYWRCESTADGSFLNRAYNDGDSTDRVRAASQITLTEVLA